MQSVRKQIEEEADEAVRKLRGKNKIKKRAEFVAKRLKEVQQGKRKVREDAKKPPPMSKKEQSNFDLGKEVISALVAVDKARERMDKRFSRQLERVNEDGEVLPFTELTRDKLQEGFKEATSSYLEALKLSNRMVKKSNAYGGVIHELGIIGKDLLESQGSEEAKALLGTRWGWKSLNTRPGS